MKILYMSCHEILEYDELKLFTELGHHCYSMGAYFKPGGDEHRKRPPLELPYDPHFTEMYLQHDRRHLIKEQLKGFDAIIIMHSPEFLTMKDGEGKEIGNWPLFRDFIKAGGRVIWRSIGQSIPHVERKLAPMRAEGLEIVRYSPAEQTIEDNVGTDVVIRFYKDPEELNGWTGSQRHIINFTQSLKERGEFTGWNAMRYVLDGLPAKIYGPGNENLGLLSGGQVSYEKQLEIFRESRAYLYHGTYPASYTLSFIEAMMVGVPIVAVGPRLGNSRTMFPNQNTYEIPSIIHSGVNGFVSDNLNELKAHLQTLIGDENKAKAISAFGRKTAIDLFGKAKIKAQWKDFLGGS